MKKIIAILALSVVMSACTNENAPSTSQVANNNETVEQNETQIIDVSPKEPADDTEEVETEDHTEEVPAESETETEDEVDETTDSDEDSDESPSKDEESSEADQDLETNEENQEAKSVVEAGDLFFLPYSSVVTINEDGVVVDENGESTPNDPAGIYNYVKYSNNIYVRNETVATNFKIVRMNDKDMTTLFEFPEGEEFMPLGLIGDKVYGFHAYYVYDNEKGFMVAEADKGSIAVVDLATGEVNDFKAGRGSSIGSATVIDGELQFTMPGDNFPADAYNYDLYKLDLTKGFDQEPELIEKDFNLQYLFGQKRFVDGKAEWNIRRADNENIYVGDKEFPFLWAETGFQDFIGNNIFYFTSGFEAGEDYYPHVQKLKIVNIDSEETVLETTIRGLKLKDGTLYYITTDGEIKSIDLDL